VVSLGAVGHSSVESALNINWSFFISLGPLKDLGLDRRTTPLVEVNFNGTLVCGVIISGASKEKNGRSLEVGIKLGAALLLNSISNQQLCRLLIRSVCRVRQMRTALRITHSFRCVGDTCWSD